MNLPMQLTILRILLTPVIVGLLFVNNIWVKAASLAVFVIASLTDWYDGYFARKMNVITMWGQFLDPLADKILVSSLFICFSVLSYVEGWMVLVIVLRDFIMTGLRSFAMIQNYPFQTNFLGKVKTSCQMFVIYFIFLAYLFTWNRPYSETAGFFQWVQNYNMVYASMLTITILTLFSGLIYLIENRGLIRKAFVRFIQILASQDIV